MKTTIKTIIADYRSLVILFIVLAVAASLQSYFSAATTNMENGLDYRQFNNYDIFAHSFYHLRESQDLYIRYPNEHWDLFKYTPTFAAFFGVFAVFPDWLGLNLWNLLNALVLLLAVYCLPKLSRDQQGLILLICAIELMTSMQNEQSNGLMAGLPILAFALLEKGKYSFAALAIVCSVFIKLFGIVAFALFLFYPQKWKLILYSVFWTAILLAVPLLFIDLAQYEFLLLSFKKMLAGDLSVSYGYSVMGWLNSWFGLTVNKLAVAGIGVLLFLLPLSRIRQYPNYTFRFLTLTSVLLWVVLFNHKAESPTFIIAMTGVALWFVAGEKNKLNLLLFCSAILLTSLSPTDIFPRVLRETLVIPYKLKAVPCILIWLKIIYDMLVLQKDEISREYEVQSR